MKTVLIGANNIVGNVIKLAPGTPYDPDPASTSRTMCPLPTPPIDGLQLITPILSWAKVNSAVAAPRRAAADAASQPA